MRTIKVVVAGEKERQRGGCWRAQEEERESLGGGMSSLSLSVTSSSPIRDANISYSPFQLFSISLLLFTPSFLLRPELKLLFLGPFNNY